MRHAIFKIPFLVFLFGGNAFSSPLQSLVARSQVRATTQGALLGAFVQCQRQDSQGGCAPGFSLEQGAFRSFSLGLSAAFRAQGLFPSQSDDMPKVTAGIYGNYYPEGLYKGGWLQLGLRDKLIEIDRDVFRQAVALSSLVGWRWSEKGEGPSSFSLSLGVEKNLSPTSEWLVVARADLGLRFLWSDIFY